EEEVRRDTSLDPRGYPQFKVKAPPGRPEYHVLVYLEPMRGNEFGFGVGIRLDGEQGEAIRRQRDTGELVSSGRLIQAGKDGFVALAMRLAGYRTRAPPAEPEERRAAHPGTVGAGYNVRKLMAGVLDETTMTAMRYRLFDAGATIAPAAPTLLFDSAQSGPGAPADDFRAPGGEALFEAVQPLVLAGRNW